MPGPKPIPRPFLLACRRRPAPVTPVWIMRQAGRYMAEYRAVRRRVGFATLCRRPDLAAEVAVTAAARLGVDAAILFSDILLILEPMGLSLRYVEGKGPVIGNPVRTPAQAHRLRAADPADLDFVYEAVRRTRRDLPPSLPLIGFSGAPFTLAAYAIEGGGSKEFLETKAFMYRHPEAWHVLMRKMALGVAGYLRAQVASGAEVLQLFDSWVGCLSPADYRRYVLPHVRAVSRRLPPGVPLIHFGTRSGGLLELMREAGGDVIGLDAGVSLDAAWRRLPGAAVQGNLDPAVLLGSRTLIRREVRRILSEAAGRPGHVFNLGHGVLPRTPVDNVRALVDFVHAS